MASVSVSASPPVTPLSVVVTVRTSSKKPSAPVGWYTTLDNVALMSDIEPVSILSTSVPVTCVAPAEVTPSVATDESADASERITVISLSPASTSAILIPDIATSIPSLVSI